MNFNSYW